MLLIIFHAPLLLVLLFDFAARCYASAVLAMGLCPCLSMSVTSRCFIETAERIELFLACELPASHGTLC